MRSKYYSSNENTVKAKALKDLINSCNTYLKPRYKKASWITNVDVITECLGDLLILA